MAFTTSAALAANGKNPKPQQKSSGCVSAVCVYHEQISTPVGQVSAGSVQGPPVQIAKKVTKALHRHKGTKTKVLHSLATNPGLGAMRVLLTSSSDQTSTPNALGAAFDLGSGPTALLAVLLGGAVLMAAGTAVRRRRDNGPPDGTSAV